jgi:hypothetical protein
MGALVTRDIVTGAGETEAPPPHDGDQAPLSGDGGGSPLAATSSSISPHPLVETVMLKLPTPPFSALYDSLRLLVARYTQTRPKPLRPLVRSGGDRRDRDPLLSMQYEAQVRIWLQTKEDLLLARRLLAESGSRGIHD